MIEFCFSIVSFWHFARHCCTHMVYWSVIEVLGLHRNASYNNISGLLFQCIWEIIRSTHVCCSPMFSHAGRDIFPWRYMSLYSTVFRYSWSVIIRPPWLCCRGSEWSMMWLMGFFFPSVDVRTKNDHVAVAARLWMKRNTRKISKNNVQSVRRWSGGWRFHVNCVWISISKVILSFCSLCQLSHFAVNGTWYISDVVIRELVMKMTKM